MSKKEKKTKCEKTKNKSQKLKVKKAQKNKWRVTIKKKSSMLTGDYRTTAEQFEQKVYEAAFLYLVSCNERWEDIHFQVMVKFQKRMCFCTEPLIEELYKKMAQGTMNQDESNQYMMNMLVQTFRLFMPVIDIIQGITAEKETDDLYETFTWMEEIDRMREYMAKERDCQKTKKKLKKLRAGEKEGLKQLKKYEKTRK